MASPATSLRAPTFLRWRTERWPRTTWGRWLVRLAVAVPFVGLADLANTATGPSVANDLLHRQAASLHFASGQLGWVAHAYPPVTIAVARLVPGGAQGLAIAGGLCTGILIQLTIERLMLRTVSVTAAVLLTAAVALTPAFWFVATQDFSAFLTLILLSVALTGLLDFTYNRSTESGFIAGIGFGLATMCDLAALPFALRRGAGHLLRGAPSQGGARDRTTPGRRDRRAVPFRGRPGRLGVLAVAFQRQLDTELLVRRPGSVPFLRWPVALARPGRQLGRPRPCVFTGPGGRGRGAVSSAACLRPWRASPASGAPSWTGG